MRNTRKVLGEGYFYKVIRYSRKRVLKIQKSRLQIFWHIYRHHKEWGIKKCLRETKRVVQAMRELDKVYEQVLEKVKDHSLLGNPYFINSLEFTQERANTLPHINKITAPEFKKVVRDYIRLLKKLWRFGVSDEVFKYSHNCGYTKKDNFAFLDFNEVTFDREEVIKDINEQIWLKMRSYKELDEEKKEIYERLMRENITLEELDRLWQNLHEEIEGNNPDKI